MFLLKFPVRGNPFKSAVRTGISTQEVACACRVVFSVLDSIALLLASACWTGNPGARITLAPSIFPSALHSRTPLCLYAGNLASTVIGPALPVRACCCLLCRLCLRLLKWRLEYADRPILPPGIYYPPGIGEERTWEAQYDQIVYDAWSKSYICEADHKLVDGGKFCKMLPSPCPCSRFYCKDTKWLRECVWTYCHRA